MNSATNWLDKLQQMGKDETTHYTQIIQGYTKTQQNMNKAEFWMHEMQKRGKKADNVAYNLLIDGYFLFYRTFYPSLNI